SVTLKPFGATGHAFAGRGTTVGPLSTDCSGAGPGRSAAVRRHRMPGDSQTASANAAWPVSTVCSDALFLALTLSVECGTGDESRTVVETNPESLRNRCMRTPS